MIDSAHWKTFRRPQAASYAANPESTWFNVGSGEGHPISLGVTRSWIPLHYNRRIQDVLSYRLSALFRRRSGMGTSCPFPANGAAMAEQSVSGLRLRAALLLAESDLETKLEVHQQQIDVLRVVTDNATRAATAASADATGACTRSLRIESDLNDHKAVTAANVQ